MPIYSPVFFVITGKLCSGHWLLHLCNYKGTGFHEKLGLVWGKLWFPLTCSAARHGGWAYCWHGMGSLQSSVVVWSTVPANWKAKCRSRPKSLHSGIQFSVNFYGYLFLNPLYFAANFYGHLFLLSCQGGVSCRVGLSSSLLARVLTNPSSFWPINWRVILGKWNERERNSNLKRNRKFS